MLICAICVMPIIFASRATSVWSAVALIGLAATAHQTWAANMFTLPSDMFPKKAIGSVMGISGMAGSLGSMIFSASAGFVLQWTGSYLGLFLISGFASSGSGHLTTAQKAVEKIRERTGIKDFTAHDLRRTAASLMTQMGIRRLIVSKILNHVEPGVTAIYDRYGYDREKREALEAWGHRSQLIISDLYSVEQSEA